LEIIKENKIQSLL